ncbi:39S ribosomal protein L1, mitochondrial isoform X2 [Aplysia californica]|uniref:39S ribosomal protein L1, mitochondrial isoform X2 n=1 Tax=Aplysia californica TaxID=6500 RepID=A0ABM1VNU8_APLCA|nr:39S ribosomal protein L1, mitochondrial isoform X2 [Aplysia californica]
MAASYSIVHHLDFRVLLKHVRRNDVLPRLSAVVCPKPSCTHMQIRHKNSKPRVRDAKVQVDSSRVFVSKKERLKARQAKNVVTESEVFLAEAPIDNVWVHKHYPPQKHSVEDALKLHKAFAEPDMLNNEDGLFHLIMKLDFTTKKQTKFIGNIRHTVLLPHEFPYGTPPAILVLCKSEEHLNLASSLGAHTFGTPAEITKLITNGVISPKDFQHVISTADCGNEILPLRSHFRDKYPQRAKGNLSLDLKGMWNLFHNGYTYESHKITEGQGSLQVPLGLVKQPIEELVENFTTYIDSVCQHRSIALGPFIQSIKVVAPPSPEEFLLRVEEYVPGYKNEEVDSDEEEAAQAGA